jgi:hypothetical protein
LQHDEFGEIVQERFRDSGIRFAALGALVSAGADFTG